jgi:hypothetical protein
MEILIRMASGITNLWSLAAFGLAAVVYLLVKRRGTIPGLAWITIWILILAPIVVSAYSTISRTNMYRIRVTVVGAQGVPVEEAMVWSSAGGEPKKVSGGWEFDVPMASRPADGKITFFASVPSAFLSGDRELELGNDYNPTVVLKLYTPQSASVRGMVIDDNGKAIVGAMVTVAGIEGEGALTDSDGNFSLAAHAANGQQVLLHVEKKGYAPTSQYHPSGPDPATIMLKRNK